jgi:hypothetical protein
MRNLLENTAAGHSAFAYAGGLRISSYGIRLILL